VCVFQSARRDVAGIMRSMRLRPRASGSAGGMKGEGFLLAVGGICSLICVTDKMSNLIIAMLTAEHREYACNCGPNGWRRVQQLRKRAQHSSRQSKTPRLVRRSSKSCTQARFRPGSLAVSRLSSICKCVPSKQQTWKCASQNWSARKPTAESLRTTTPTFRLTAPRGAVARQRSGKE